METWLARVKTDVPAREVLVGADTHPVSVVLVVQGTPSVDGGRVDLTLAQAEILETAIRAARQSLRERR